MELPPQLGHLPHLHVLQPCQEGQECQEGDEERGDGSTVEETAEENQSTSTTTARPSLTRSTLPRVEKKLNHDFLTCHGAVEAVINKSVETIIWLEDDVVLMEHFFSTLFSLLNFRRSRLQSMTWLDIKLYAPPRLRGYWLYVLLTESRIQSLV